MLTFTLEVTQKHAIHSSNKYSMCVMALSNHLCKKKDMGYAKRRKENKCMLKNMRKKRKKKRKK
jgi:hypothetical protein